MNLTTHVLDTSRGRPAVGMTIRLERQDGNNWREMADKQANADGRAEWRVDSPGRYQLRFDTGGYFTGAFYPWVTVTFRIADPSEDCHVPLLISPFGYSTYRGS